YLAEKSVKDAGDKISQDIKTAITEKIEALKKASDGTDAEAIKTAASNLSTELQKIGQALYGNQGGNQEEQKGPTEPQPKQE
ncbi:MAG: Hsp70 family protein, partial [Patescibacteria group bacterium]